MAFRESGNLYVDSLQPGESMPYAWDEPTMVTKLRVQAKVAGRMSEGKVSDFVLDRLGDAPMMLLPTHGEGEVPRRGDKAGRIYRTLSNDVPDELRKKLVSLLAAEFSKKVYVTVYADGPTRVLRFSDEKNISSLEQQHVVLDLAARLKQVEGQLRAVNGQFARLSGVSGAHAWSLDLYGRMPTAKEEPQHNNSILQRRPSRKAALPEGAQALVQYASRHLPAMATAARHARNHSRDLSVSPSGSFTLQGRESPSHQSGSQKDKDRGEKPAAQRYNTRSVSFADDRSLVASAGPSLQPPPGVLQVEDPTATQQVENSPTKLYDHHVIQAPSTSAVRSDSNVPENLSNSRTPLPTSEIMEEEPSEIVPQRPQHRRADSGRDWGHITLDSQQGAGTRKASFATMGASQSGMNGGGGGASGAVTVANLARRQELLRLMSDGDAVLLIGGDLTVTVVQAKHLSGTGRSTHAFARIRVADPVPPPGLEERTKQTSVIWQSADPVWDEQLVFRDVCAASELVVELWDLGGTKSADQLNALSTNPQGKHTLFLRIFHN